MTPRLLTITALSWLFLALAGSAWGAEDVNPGQTVPYRGVLIIEERAEALVRDLDAGRTAIAVEAKLGAVIAEKNAEIAELKAALASSQQADLKREIALAVAEDRDKRRQENEDRLLKVLDVSNKAMEHAVKVIERADKRIETLENRLFWQQVLGFLGPIGIAIAVAAF